MCVCVGGVWNYMRVGWIGLADVRCVVLCCPKIQKITTTGDGGAQGGAGAGGLGGGQGVAAAAEPAGPGQGAARDPHRGGGQRARRDHPPPRAPHQRHPLRRRRLRRLGELMVEGVDDWLGGGGMIRLLIADANTHIDTTDTSIHRRCPSRTCPSSTSSFARSSRRVPPASTRRSSCARSAPTRYVLGWGGVGCVWDGLLCGVCGGWWGARKRYSQFHQWMV